MPISGRHNSRPASGPEYVISGPCNRLKCTRNFLWMMAILWMNLNFIELLTISQLTCITIWNSSDGNNIKPQATKRQVKWILISVFDTWLSKVHIIILSSAFEGTKKRTCSLCPKRLCTSGLYQHWSLQVWSFRRPLTWITNITRVIP